MRQGVSLQGQGWKIVASFEGVLPKRIKGLPLDQMFEISSIKKVLWTLNFEHLKFDFNG